VSRHPDNIARLGVAAALAGFYYEVSMVSPLEAMADAIMQYEGWHVGSRSWRNRNPGNLRHGRRQIGTDPDGYAVYAEFIHGYLDLLEDLSDKIQGKSKHNLTPKSTLQDLFDVYAPRGDNNQPNAYASFAAGYLTHALGREVTTWTQLRALGVTGYPT
jgi:hypothetical protein